MRQLHARPFRGLALVAVLSLAACSPGGGSTTAPSAPAGATTAPTEAPPGPVEAEFKLRGANSVGENLPSGKAYEMFATCLNERTNGLIELEIFHAAQLGSDAEALELAQNGALDFTQTTIYSNIIPVGTVFDLPFLFKDEDHWRAVTTGAPGQAIIDAGTGSGIKILSYHLGGWRDIYGSVKIESVDDLKGLKLRTLQSPAYVELFQALGAVPTPLAFGEVYLGLQQGTLDGAETALPSMYDAKHHEVSKYVAQTHHGLSSVVWAISEATWDKLPADAQAVVVECDREATDFQVTTQLAHAERVDRDLQEVEGMEFTQPDLAPFRTVAQEQVYPKLITADDQKALLQQVIEMGN